MSRDAGLEELIRQEVGARDGVSEKPMFGGLAFLLDGKLLCGARNDGMLVRLGKGNDGWALLSATIPCANGCLMRRSPMFSRCRRNERQTVPCFRLA
jgi:hypothetical protein